MMKKLMAVILCMFVLTSCGGSDSCELDSPAIRCISENVEYGYIIDENTGNVYLKYSFGRQAGISIILNPDGTPMTLEQLEEKLK